jgi:predicted SnoaL-like aldol condensation-catalyzing enzyme
MRRTSPLLAGLLALAASFAIPAQSPPTAAPDQMALLKSDDPKLAANKKLVFDMWRAIIQAGRVDLAEQYFTEDYIQHNPNVASGRAAMVEFMKSTRPVKPIDKQINFPVISFMAEGDMVMVATVSKEKDPDGNPYIGTHFDLFRIQDGKIAEHWDSVPKSKEMARYNPNTQLEKP